MLRPTEALIMLVSASVSKVGLCGWCPQQALKSGDSLVLTRRETILAEGKEEGMGYCASGGLKEPRSLVSSSTSRLFVRRALAKIVRSSGGRQVHLLKK